MSAVHSIVATAGRLITKDLELPEPGGRALRRELMRLYGKPELALAVRSLIALAAHLERDRGATACADSLLAIAASASGALARLGQVAEAARTDAVRARQQAYGRMTGRSEKTRAPRFGARPDGTIRAAVANIPTIFR